MPIGKGNVLIGMSERTSRQAISQLAATLFQKKAARARHRRGMPKLRAAMHLDTVFTFADRDCVLTLSRHRQQDRVLLVPAGLKNGTSSCARTTG